MQLTAREDIAAPIDQVFAALSEFEGFERQAMRRGATVQRVDPLTHPGVGMKWNLSFEMRGKQRELVVELVTFDAPNEMAFEGKSTGIQADFKIELLALARNRTRMELAFEVAALNLSSRLLVQSLKLARGTISKKFKLRVADYARGLEDRLQRTA